MLPVNPRDMLSFRALAWSLVGMVVQCVAAIAGLAIALAVYYFFGALPPFWLGGEASSPLVSGAWVFLIGAIPFYLIVRLVFRCMKKVVTWWTLVIVGIGQGMLFHPLLYVTINLLRTFQSRGQLDPALIFLMGLTMTAIASVAVASVVIALLSVSDR